MKNKKVSGLLYTAVMGVAVLSLASCAEKKFRVSGTITQAKDSVLYLENMSLNGPKAVDSVKLDENGEFEFSQKAPEACRRLYGKHHREGRLPYYVGQLRG